MQLDDSRRRAARGADGRSACQAHRERSESGERRTACGSSNGELIRGLLAREHSRVGAPVEVLSSDSDGNRLFREYSVRVSGEPTELLVGPWHECHDGERGYVASVTGDECAGRLLTVAIERE